MKKYLSLLFAVALTLGFAACSDVPAPYGINDIENNNGGEEDLPSVRTLPFTATFAQSLEGFTAIDKIGNYLWKIDYGSAAITAYVNEENNRSDSWLISPQLNLKNVQHAKISFEFILRYVLNKDELKTNYKLLISKTFESGTPQENDWTELEWNVVEGSNWNDWYNSGNINVPEEFCGQENVHVALRYIANSKAATWEVKNFSVTEGEGDYNPEPVVPADNDQVQQLDYTETFASSLGNYVNVNASGATGWKNDYSTAAISLYDNSTQTNKAGVNYLVSPPIALGSANAVHISYDYILRYNRGDENQKLLVIDNDNYDATNIEANNWDVLVAKHTEGSNWTDFSKVDVNVPSELMGKTIRVALRHSATDTESSTWEVKNLTVAAGAASGGTTPTPDPSGDEGITNAGYLSNLGVALISEQLGLANAAELTTITLVDGTTLVFDKNGGTNAPKYYSIDKSLRLYAQNKLTVTSSRPIKSIVFQCVATSSSGVSYMGNETLTATDAAGATVAPAKDETNYVVTFTPAVGTITNTLAITNSHTSNSGGSQMRIVSIEVIYN
ncbi:MAG: choice-of-anchor J domain-containing protein [Bacteroidaceae bacterium]|nr:choice-of-anchor J domain-containing protein [Bacteroidaceae bacterium]